MPFTKGKDVISFFQSNLIDNSVDRDTSNYCEIEVAPHYDVTGHQAKLNFSANCQNIDVRDFGPYSDLEFSQPPLSHVYGLTSTSRDQRLNKSFPPQVIGSNETYSALEDSGNKEYDTTAHKGHSMKFKYHASDTQGFDSCYSDLEGLPYNEYDTISHTDEPVKLLGIVNPDVYSSVDLSHDDYDATSFPVNKGSNIKMKTDMNSDVVSNFGARLILNEEENSTF